MLWYATDTVMAYHRAMADDRRSAARKDREASAAQEDLETTRPGDRSVGEILWIQASR